MVDTLLPKLETPEARRAVTEAVLALLSRWGLPEAKQAELLGVRDFSAVAKSRLLPDDASVLERAGHLLAIGRALRKLCAEKPAADWWVTSPCDTFGGFSPLIIMLGGLNGIKRVRVLLESKMAEGNEVGDS